MPIRINLLAEQLAAEETRKRDPVKRAYWISGAVVGAVLVWTGLLQVRLTRASNELAAQNARWKALEPQFKKVDGDFRRTTAIETRLDALDRMSTNRFLWGNALNALQLTVVDGIEVMKLTGRQSFEFVEAIPSKTNTVAGTTNLTIIAGKPGSSRQTVRITIQGRDVSPVPGSQIIKYKEVIADSSYFSNALKNVPGVKGAGVAFLNQSPVQPDLSHPTNRLFVDFTLECQYQEALRTNKTVIR